MQSQDNKSVNFPKRVLLLSVSTGEGHNSAARAIAEVLNQKNIDCEIIDSVSFKGKQSHSFITEGYNRIIRHAPMLFGLAYVLGAAYDNMRLPSPIKSYHSSYADKIYQYIKDGNFDCVVCTHLFSMHTATAIRKKYAPDLPCYGVITDYTAIPFYRGSQLDAYFVPDSRTRDMLIKKGIPSDKIIISGIPVSPKFSQDISKSRARELLNIGADKKVIVISAGGAGCGKLMELCKRLKAQIDGEYEVYVFTGKNTRLKAKIDKIAGENGVIRTLAFTPDIYLYIKAADVAMTKPGGLSSTEFATSGVPMILLKAIPGCETCNKRYFVKHNLATYCNSVKKAVKQTLNILADNSRSELIELAGDKKVINAFAATDIVEYIIENNN